MLALAVRLALSLAPQTESLLPPPPAGWRREHLELPLSFAPELEYRGSEDLAFAPGMFAPESDSYFSYALAWRLEGDVRVDEGMLARFLETYFRGLCRTVAAERKLERDASTVKAKVRREPTLFRASVALFDPFTTGEPLDLELWSYATPRATELLGLASPLDSQAPVWRDLNALAVAWHASRPPPVFLNHLYAVVDEETYAALVGSSFLRETFAVAEERTTVRADLTYTGLYLYGQRTYFEFLQPGAATGTGLALGVEQVGALDTFARRLADEGVRSQAAPITRKLGAEQLPWFQILGLEMPPSTLNVFAMEYEEPFLARWHAGKAPEEGGITRAAVLERYAAALDKSRLRETVSLLDVSSVELTLSAAERERVLTIARAARWEVEEHDGAWTCLGPEVRLLLRDPGSTSANGVTRFELALREPLAHEPLELGRVSIRFQGRSATVALRP